MASSLALIGQVQRLKAIGKKRRTERQARQVRPPPKVDGHWTPNPGPQEQFYNSTCREVLYGGAAGGGKSAALTALVLKWSHLPGFNGVVFRRDATQFDDLISKSEGLFPRVYPGLEPVHSPHFRWTFPSGATAKYRHCQHEKDAKKYDGWEINLLCFDELTHFTEKQYLAICARVRTSKRELPTLIRATTNPGGEGHDWVFKRWGAWLDPYFEAEGLAPRFNERGDRLPPARPGEVFWIRKVGGREVYYRQDPKNRALSRTFIPALASDNPHLSDNDPNYEAQLEELDPVRREQLKNGNWLVKPSAGKYFKRTWVEFVDRAPVEGVIARVRAWDLAGTEKKDGKSEPDWTAGVLMSFTKDRVFIEDVVRIQGNPGEVKALIKTTAELDGKRVAIFIPQDPGQAGKSQISDYAKELRGWHLFSHTNTGDKVRRFGPFSSHAENKGGEKHVCLVRGPWNTAYVEELEAFPSPGIKDDQVDATSDGFNTISDAIGRRRGSSGATVINSSDRS